MPHLARLPRLPGAAPIVHASSPSSVFCFYFRQKYTSVYSYDRYIPITVYVVVVLGCGCGCGGGCCCCRYRCRCCCCCCCCYRLHINPFILSNDMLYDEQYTPSPSWSFIPEKYKLCGHSEREKQSHERTNVDKSNANVPGTRAQQKTPPKK